MPAEYKLKNSPINRNRLHKIAKTLVDESKEDRKAAQDAFSYFRDIVENSTTEESVSTAQKCMVDCLKLAQDSRNKVIKALELIIKADTKYAATPMDAEEDVSKLTFDDFDTTN